MNKNKNTIHNQKHLTLTERIYIEQELVQGSTFSSIASIIDKDSSTISKELKHARIIEDAGYTGKCHACPNFIPWNCGQLCKPPYVCNACDKYKWCPLPKAFHIIFLPFSNAYSE